MRQLIISFILSFPLFVFSQHTNSISGQIRDNQGPIIQASISLKEISKGTISNSSGAYLLKNIKPGNYTLIVSSIGYIIQEKKISIKEGENLRFDFRLTENTTEMKTVTVTGKTEIQEVRESGFSVNAIETKQFANTTADLNQILNRSTGVRIREQGGLGSNFNFSINGLSGKSVKYFLDGVPMEILGSAMSLNNIPVNLAERIEVYKGVVPVELGSDAMGGAINVLTNQKTSNYLDLSHSYGSFNTHRTALNGQYKDQKTGLTIRGSAFYNYSDNNYIMRDVDVLDGGTRNGDEITDSQGVPFKKTNVRRFHDNYDSKMAQLEAGLTNKKWADVFFIGGAYTDSYQELQTGFDQNVVYGKVNRKSDAFSGFMRYKKDNLFIEGLNANLFASKSKDTYITTDTLFGQYYWDGSWTKKSVSEMASIKKIQYLVRPRTFARANLSYKINDNHSLNLNYTIDHLKNETYNYLYTDKDDMPGVLNKQIIGFAYQQQLLDKKLTNILFAKYYALGLERTKWINNNNVLLDTAFNNIGYGIATRYSIKPSLGIKVSFEHAYRLQEVEEMFGDGLNIQPNPDLIPETSDNINLGGFYNFIINKKHKFNIEANGFYRNARDFIYPVPDQRSGAVKNENKSSVK